jgi:hypothetical protein
VESEFSDIRGSKLATGGMEFEVPKKALGRPLVVPGTERLVMRVFGNCFAFF